MAITLYSAQLLGIDAHPVAVEIDISPGLHIFSIVGLADKEVQESRERINAAIKNIGALAPHKKSQRVIVNLAPADIKKEGPAFDLPIAIGYLLASNQITFDPRKIIFLGELGLDGSLKKVTGVLSIALAVRAAGFSTMIVPKGNGKEAALFPEFSVYEAESLTEVLEFLVGRKNLEKISTETPNTSSVPPRYDLKDIRGQEAAKRALEVAAAGGHNILMKGPPGTGKTILAQSLSGILPELSFNESLEVTKIYSVAGMLDTNNTFLTQRPFRNPHHTASYSSVIGGGTYPRPGEITLAHRGVLFLDELPEFDRRVIESLRQPLEEKMVTVSRVTGSQTFPAQFMLVAAMNPCPCGNFGNKRVSCTCSPGAITRYTKKISGPLLDRIDIHIEVPTVEYEKLEAEEGEASQAARARVEKARKIQQHRFRDTTILTNAEMGLKELKQLIHVPDNLKPILKLAHERYHLSARAYHRMLKISRTIADLAGSETILESHLLEALQYRPKTEF